MRLLLHPGRQARERKPSNAWARKIPALTRPITAVTVSIIANFPCAPARRRERPQPCTVKKIQLSESKIRPSDDLMQQIVRKRDSGAVDRANWPVIRRGAQTRIDSPPWRSPHFRRDRVAVSSCSGAEVGRIVGAGTLPLEAGARPAEW
jgi:hypothetical protein